VAESATHGSHSAANHTGFADGLSALNEIVAVLQPVIYKRSLPRSFLNARLN
jgi:hypothetical protein